MSEPVSEYIRFEHEVTFTNVVAGEEVRWLPRRRASEIALPGNDCWIFDGRLVMFNHFTGEGEVAPDGREITSDPEVVKLCASAFEAVWERAVPHERYRAVRRCIRPARGDGCLWRGGAGPDQDRDRRHRVTAAQVHAYSCPGAWPCP